MAAREPAPPRNGASARIAEALRIEMAHRGIDRQQLADAIEKATGKRPTRMWLSRTLKGGSHLTVQRPSEVPNDLLRQVANAIDPENGNELAVRLASLAAPTMDDMLTGEDEPVASATE